ncbi:MAG: phosphoenolpyruvate synthase, partial [Calditrichaeota bacterium]
QYQMEKYLQAVDDGWIMRRARYYRGAVQIEDEEAWGERFLTWLLAKDDFLTTQFFLCRQMSKSIPHHVKVDQAMHIRALAKAIADSVSLFMDIRSKIHGEPDATDIERVKSFRRRYRDKLTPEVEEKLATLEAELEAFYRELNVQHLKKYLATFPLNTPVGFQLRTALQMVDATNPGEHPEEDSAEQAPAANHDTNEDHGQTSVASRFQDLAHLLWVIREHIASPHAPDLRLAMLDLSNEVESILVRMAAAWQPTTLEALLEKDYALAEAAAGCGYVEIWEWQKLEPALYPLPRREQMSLAEYLDRIKTSRREVEWGAGMFRAVYNPVVSLFSTFEPLAGGFIDDGIRSSVLLPFGEVVGQLSDIATRFSGLSNEVLGITHQSAIHGLNPGIAVGTLEVVTALPEGAELSADKIYMLRSAPADLKPVAGIATVSERNLVSHVQLLARNLGIPNAVISLQNLEELLPFSGTRVFYAVSPRGRVILKPASEMTAEERALVEELEVKQTKIFVPTNEIDLTGTELRDLKSVRATDSGKICGPKAANLGQLK